MLDPLFLVEHYLATATYCWPAVIKHQPSTMEIIQNLLKNVISFSASSFLCLCAGNIRGRGHYVFRFWVLVRVISQNAVRESLQIWHNHTLGLKDSIHCRIIV